jgi:hypothetical protein
MSADRLIKVWIQSRQLSPQEWDITDAIVKARYVDLGFYCNTFIFCQAKFPNEITANNTYL